MKRLQGKNAVVTGAGSGIGAATAHRLASEGAAVVVADLDEAAAEAVAKAIEADGGQAIACAADVSSRAGIEALVGLAVSSLGRLDVLHNNAGVGAITPLAMLDDTTIDRLFDINVRSVLHGLAVVGPLMLEAGGGSIVNTASTAGLWGAPMQAVYSATKGAILALTRSAAVELAPTVRVNAVCPGGVRTRFTETMVGSAEAARIVEAIGEKVHLLGRNAEPEEIAAAVAFLASDDASFCTGMAMVVDGGMTAGARIDLG